ncbi:hypothetical protein IAR55_000214 [Kwoniella newhampshirensis]|uniref:Major facilitator superfamily (MFS) profile domain-containing protein n=1 Tax=Kwoniella newhampshirensis TaxID=1651941 RepID=A0AAW0Z616_9TREE
MSNSAKSSLPLGSPLEPIQTRSHHQLAPTPSRSHANVDPFPLQLHLTRSHAPGGHPPQLHRPPTRNDGLDNIPPPLPSSPIALQRALTRDPDLELQMGVNDDDVGPPPEGGKDAWLCVISAFFVLFCIFGFTTVFGQLKIYYMAHQLQGYSESQVAWIASIQAFLVFSGSIVSGRFFDSHGARILTVLGTTLSVAALVALAFCKEYYQFILAHAAFGLSGSLMYSPATAVVGHWFMRRRSTAVGIVVCGSGLAGVIYPIALKRLFDETSYRNTLLIIAAMNAVLMFPAWFYLKARLPPRAPPPLRSLLGPWKDIRYTCLVAGSCLVMLNFFSPYFNAPTLASSNNLSANLSSYSIAILQAGSFLGRASSGVLADAFGVWTVFITVTVGCSISIFAFWVASPIAPAAAVVGLVAYGFFSGAWITLVAASTGAISPTREFGMRLGMLWSLTAIPGLVGPVICGVLISSHGQIFKYAGIFVGSSHIVGAVVTIAPRIVEILGDFTRKRKGEKVDEVREGTVEEKD